MRIVNLRPEDNDRIQQAAVLLVEGFKDTGSVSWPDLEAGMKEVEESLRDDRITLVAVDDTGVVLGWIGGIRGYAGQYWELHPLVVKPEFHHQGVGCALVTALQNRVKELGGVTIYLGTDDENHRTSLSGTELYPNVLEKLLKIESLGNHPYEFYRKVGFTIVGIIPDANGWGKPDIVMDKRVTQG